MKRAQPHHRPAPTVRFRIHAREGDRIRVEPEVTGDLFAGLDALERFSPTVGERLLLDATFDDGGLTCAAVVRAVEGRYVDLDVLGTLEAGCRRVNLRRGPIGAAEIRR